MKLNSRAVSPDPNRAIRSSLSLQTLQQMILDKVNQFDSFRNKLQSTFLQRATIRIFLKADSR